MKNNSIYSSLVLIALLSTNISFAQEGRPIQTKADLLFSSQEYHNAAKLYEKLASEKKAKTSNIERLAESYLKINNYELAENWYARAVQQKDFNEQTLLNYANALKQNGKYKEAKEVYKQYADKKGEQDEALLAMRGADSAVHWMANPQKVNIETLAGVNTSGSEFGLVKTPSQYLYAGEANEQQVKKTGMTGNAFLKIFQIQLGNEPLKPQMMTAHLNTSKYHVGPIEVSADGQTYFVTRTHEGDAKQKFKESGYKWKKANLELVIYQQVNGEWKEQDFPYNDVKSYSVGHAALNTDESRLYFASDMPGGKGGTDIWYVERQANDTWGSPQNAGSHINTKYDEMFPSFFGNKLYFSSNGHAGMGGLDLFEIQLNANTNQTPKNLGYPFNSASDDFALRIDTEDAESKTGFLSSNRRGGAGGDDIYSFNLSKPIYKITIEGTTYDKKTNQQLSAVTLTLLGDNRQIKVRKTSGDNGYFAFEADKLKDYVLLAEREGYHADSVRVKTPQPSRDTTIKVALYLEPVYETGNKFVLENIYYDFDKHNIRSDAAVVLDQLVRTMRDNPTLKIELSSHTDSRGSNKYNEKLSQRRAQSAVDYIVSKGIDNTRIVAKGYGENRLINHCADGVSCTIDQHQQNRRTEVEVLSY